MKLLRAWNGMSWPAASAALGELEWELRYGDPAGSRMFAASVVAAYAELIRCPRAKREAVIRELRKGPGLA